MNILFLTLNKIEDTSEKGIYIDLIKKIRDEGHHPYIITPRQQRENLPTVFEEIEGISFLKVKIGNITKTNFIKKGISTILIERLYTEAIGKYLQHIKFDLILYSTPPITLVNAINYVKKRDGAKTYLLLKDIFPQNAVDIKLFKSNGLVDKFFRRKERHLYSVSDFIGCMSPANVNYILRNNHEISKNRIEINPNTIEPHDINISQVQKKEIREKYNLPQDKSIFIYGGNLGKPQGIDFLIECLKKNEHNKDSYLLVVGSGTEFNKLNKYFERAQPNNAKLLKQLPKEDYELLANTCDVGLIFLDNRFTIPNFPSRLLSYMQASMPVLAATDPNTDIGEIIEEGHFGYSCISDNVEKFNELVIRLSDEKLQEQMGKNARRYLEDNYTSQHSYDIIMSHFN